MKNLTRLQQNILKTFLKNDVLQSSEVHSILLKDSEKISLVSVKRNLSEMVKLGVLNIQGAGRSTSYSINTLGRLISDIDPTKYVEMEPDKRYGFKGYNFDLFPEFPSEIFDTNEIKSITSATNEYRKRLKSMSYVIR